MTEYWKWSHVGRFYYFCYSYITEIVHSKNNCQLIDNTKFEKMKNSNINRYQVAVPQFRKQERICEINGDSYNIVNINQLLKLTVPSL